MPDEIDALNNLTHNAKVFVEKIEAGTALITDENIVAKALSLPDIIPSIQDVILEEVRFAIEETEEFNIPELSEPLLELFSHPGIIHVDPNGDLNIRGAVEDIVGNEADFFDGINIARETLNLDPSRPLEVRAAYWRKIYQTAREGLSAPENVASGKKMAFRDKFTGFYEKTIDVRLEAWAGKAPYWVFMDHGAESPYAYPRYGPTNFIQNAELNAQDIVNNAIIEVNNQMENIILLELEKFVQQPDEVQPGDILREFFADGKKYLVHVTPMGRLGVRRG